MVLNQQLNNHRILKRLVKALIRLRVCSDWSEALLVAHTTLFKILCTGSFILKRKRELVALLLLSYGCLVTVNALWLFLTVPWVGLWYEILVFPDHTHSPFFYRHNVEHSIKIPSQLFSMSKLRIKILRSGWLLECQCCTSSKLKFYEHAVFHKFRNTHQRFLCTVDLMEDCTLI